MAFSNCKATNQPIPAFWFLRLSTDSARQEEEEKETTRRRKRRRRKRRRRRRRSRRVVSCGRDSNLLSTKELSLVLKELKKNTYFE